MPPWSNLPKTADDNTTIDEEIDAKIAVHNSDAEAHLDTDESLEVHRTNPVVDHPAESVVNDKLQIRARAYVAIVDIDDEEAFDTISSAVEYAIESGGGTILVTPGTHYIGEALVLPYNVNITGTDKDSCIISCGSSDSDCLIFDELASQPVVNQYFSNLTFESDTGYVFQMADVELYAYAFVQFKDCAFSGDNMYIDANLYRLYLLRCDISVGAEPAFLFDGRIDVEQSNVTGKNITGTGTWLERANEGAFDLVINLINTELYNYTSDPYSWFPDIDTGDIAVRGCRMNNTATPAMTPSSLYVQNNVISLHNSHYFNITGDRYIITSNAFAGGTGNRVRLPSGSDKNIVTSNMVGTSVTDSGSGNVVADNITS